MNEAVVRRFIKIAGIGLLVASLVWVAFGFLSHLADRPPGDYYTEKGDIELRSKNWDEAFVNFNKAMEEEPNHRGALMGLGIVHIQKQEYDRAVDVFDRLIVFLHDNLEPDDATGIGALAAAFANRGIVLDRLGRHEDAFQDYVKALRIDEGAVDEPGIFVKALNNPSTLSSVRKRAEYLERQFELPEDRRLLRVPEIDGKQPMYKP